MAADDAPSAFSSAAASRLEQIKRALMAEILQRLQRLDQSNGQLSSEEAALDNARRIRGQIMDLMREAGAPVVESVGEAAVMDAVDAALRSHAPAPSLDNGGPIGFSVDADARASIARSVSGVLDEIPGVFDTGAQAIRKAMDVGLNTGSSLQDVIEGVSQALDTTFGQAQTAVDSSIRAGMQLAAIQQAQRGAEATGTTLLLLFDGPDDAKVRPWCEEHLDRVYTLDAGKQMTNDIGQPALAWRGGFNCRHRWSAIDEETAKAEGYE